jgi:hypothetical protein
MAYPDLSPLSKCCTFGEGPGMGRKKPMRKLKEKVHHEIGANDAHFIMTYI